MDTRAQWDEDAAVLARIGAVLFQQNTKLRVSLPQDLAALARTAWERDDPPTADTSESEPQRRVREQAATLALIGLSLENAAPTEEEHVAIELDAWFIGDALKAADEAGLLQQK